MLDVTSYGWNEATYGLFSVLGGNSVYFKHSRWDTDLIVNLHKVLAKPDSCFKKSLVLCCSSKPVQSGSPVISDVISWCQSCHWVLLVFKCWLHKQWPLFSPERGLNNMYPQVNTLPGRPYHEYNNTNFNTMFFLRSTITKDYKFTMFWNGYDFLQD